MKKNLLLHTILGFASFFSVALNAQNLSVGGTIRTEQGVDIKNVSVVLLNDQQVVLDSIVVNGSYSFNNLPEGNYRLRISKTLNPLNGVSTFDMVLVSRHILGMAPIASPYARLASDINRDRKITVWDLVYARSIILGINTHFPDLQSWHFVPANLPLQGLTNPFVLAYGTANTVALTATGSNFTEYSFIGYKVFDVNNTASLDE
ncbi:MAG: hypothetical protein ACKV1O_01360 [Saprospiraceae bacterium]